MNDDVTEVEVERNDDVEISDNEGKGNRCEI